MSLSSLYLDAFSEVAKQGSFSMAAKKLSITQSALSQRILNLEREIGSTLFIREPSGIRPTELGLGLLRYCHSREMLEAEFMTKIEGSKTRDLSGTIRLAGFSTITRSVLLPVLGSMLREHPALSIELRTEELRNIPGLLSTGNADFVFLNSPLTKQGVENRLLGYEENVLIQATGSKVREDVYLDHDPEDSTTFDFFKAQSDKAPIIKRSYLDEIYNIVEGVRLGLGRAVVPLHIAQKSKGVEVVQDHKSVKVPVYLTYYTEAFYTELQKLILERFTREVPKALSSGPLH